MPLSQETEKAVRVVDEMMTEHNLSFADICRGLYNHRDFQAEINKRWTHDPRASQARAGLCAAMDKLEDIGI